MPSSALDSMNLGAMGGLISLAKLNGTQPIPAEIAIAAEKKDKPEKKA